MTDQKKGLLIAGAGVLAICPDVLWIRLIDADAITLLVWRGFLSFFGIAIGLFIFRPRSFISGFRTMGWAGFWLAIVWTAGTFAFVTSVTLTTAANALFINSAAPLFAAIIGRVLGERVPLRTWLAIALAMAGIGVIAGGSIGGEGASLTGDLLALGSALSGAVTFVIAHKYRHLSMVPAMAVAGLMTGLLALPFGDPFSLAPGTWIYVAIMGLVTVSAGFALLTLGARYLPAPEVSLLILGEAVIGPLLVWWVMGEVPANQSLIGGTIVLTALAGLNLYALYRPEAEKR